jgi:hypothetical protein
VALEAVIRKDRQDVSRESHWLSGGSNASGARNCQSGKQQNNAWPTQILHGKRGQKNGGTSAGSLELMVIEIPTTCQ